MGQTTSFFHIGEECRIKNTTFNCNLTWADTVNGPNLTQIGGVEHGNFEANGDLAGLGTLLAFTIPSGIAILAGLWMTLGASPAPRKNTPSNGNRKNFTIRPNPRGGRGYQNRKSKRTRPTAHNAPHQPEEDEASGQGLYDVLEALLVGMSDSQLVFGLALAIYFQVVGKCSVSMYHFKMGLNLIIVACINNLLTLILIRSFWRTWFSSIVRLGLTGALIGLLGKILYILKKLNYDYGLPEPLPPKSRTDSLILLPAACFVDSDYLQTFTALDLDQAKHQAKAAIIGRLEKVAGWVEIVPPTQEGIIWGFMVCFFGLVIFYRLTILLLQIRRRYLSHQKYESLTMKPSGFFSAWRFVVCLVALIFSLVVSIIIYIRVWSLREWVFHSHWLKNNEYLGNEEARPTTFGQITTLCALGGFFVVAFDRLTWKAG